MPGGRAAHLPIRQPLIISGHLEECKRLGLGGTPLVLVSSGRRATRLLQHAVRAEDRQRGCRLGRADEADVRV